MKTLESLLQGHPFLEGLSPAYVELIAGCAANVRFDAGAYLFREGDEANHFYIIRHGRVGLEIFLPHQGALTLQTVREGEILGWSWVFPPYRWHADARALELTRAISLDGACLRRKCEEDHDLGYELMKRFAHVLDQALEVTRLQLVDLYGRSPQAS